MAAAFGGSEKQFPPCRCATRAKLLSALQCAGSAREGAGMKVRLDAAQSQDRRTGGSDNRPAHALVETSYEYCLEVFFIATAQVPAVDRLPSAALPDSAALVAGDA